jgi:hypothetical protein
MRVLVQMMRQQRSHKLLVLAARKSAIALVRITCHEPAGLRVHPPSAEIVELRGSPATKKVYGVNPKTETLRKNTHPIKREGKGWGIGGDIAGNLNKQ